MGSSSLPTKLRRALERIDKSDASRRRRREALERRVPLMPGWSPAPTAFEVPNHELRKKAQQCQNPIVLTSKSAPFGERVRAVPCGKWDCESCGPKRCAEFSRRALLGVASVLEEQKLANEQQEELPYELTLTFRPDDLPGDPRSKEQMTAASRAWNRFRRAVAEGRRRLGLPPLIYLNVREYTKRGVPHYHVIVIGNPWPVSVPYRERPSDELSKREAKERGLWLAQFGFGFVHTWNPVRDVRSLGYYLTDYVTKAASMKLPKHCPRYSSSRGFTPALPDWRAVRASHPGLFDLPGQRRLLGTAAEHEGEIVRVRAQGRFWTKPNWRKFVAGVKARRRLERARRLAFDAGREMPTEAPPPESLRFVATLSAAAPA